MCSQVGNQCERERRGLELQVNCLSGMNLSLQLSDVISCASPGECDPCTLPV